jgi:hypothetical protein
MGGYDTMTNEEAELLLKEYMAIEKERMDLKVRSCRSSPKFCRPRKLRGTTRS